MAFAKRVYVCVPIGAFVLALALGCYTHYYKIVQNEYFGYPQVRPSSSRPHMGMQRSDAHSRNGSRV